MVKNEFNGKISVIKSKLCNYSYFPVNQVYSNLNNFIEIDNEILNYYSKQKDDKIVIDGYLDIDCSNTNTSFTNYTNSVYLSCGNRGILSVIDSVTNKLTLVDLLSN